MSGNLRCFVGVACSSKFGMTSFSTWGPGGSPSPNGVGSCRSCEGVFPGCANGFCGAGYERSAASIMGVSASNGHSSSIRSCRVDMDKA
eukprot:4869991-Pleurochrysis_carterae.AAC.2